MSPHWSYVLTAMGVAGVLLVGNHRRAGWAVCLFAQPLWIAYALLTEQWGFIISGLVYGVAFARNWLSWRAGAPVREESEVAA